MSLGEDSPKGPLDVFLGWMSCRDVNHPTDHVRKRQKQAHLMLGARFQNKGAKKIRII